MTNKTLFTLLYALVLGLGVALIAASFDMSLGARIGAALIAGAVAVYFGDRE